MVRLALVCCAILSTAFVGAFYAGAAYQKQFAKTPFKIADPSLWFTVTHVTVEDGAHGEDPRMMAERAIHRPFRGRWTVEVTTEDGEFVCSASSIANYAPDNKLPSKPFGLFGWWMHDGRSGPQQCNNWPIPVGCYYADTIWEFQPDGFQKTSVSKRSNNFCIR